jgi:two-component system sensor histidine kinase SenX3
MHLAINDEVKRLTRMITEYLDITRLESGATEVRLSPVRVESLVERILLLLDPVAARRGIRLVRNFGRDLPPLLADPDLLSRAVENLVSNAIKYSPANTEVAVSAGSDPSTVWIDVADHGYGISEHDLTRIFEKFYRVPRVQDAGVPGTGLGLALVREIAELHGGSVTVKSEVGAGSTFSIRIPR